MARVRHRKSSFWDGVAERDVFGRAHQEGDSLFGILLPNLAPEGDGIFGVLARVQQHQVVAIHSQIDTSLLDAVCCADGGRPGGLRLRRKCRTIVPLNRAGGGNVVSAASLRNSRLCTPLISVRQVVRARRSNKSRSKFLVSANLVFNRYPKCSHPAVIKVTEIIRACVGKALRRLASLLPVLSVSHLLTL